MKILKSLKSLLGVLSPAQIRFFTWRRGNRVGADEFGNVYYRTSARKGYTHERRWVIYKDGAEASRVPPEWHGWLHHQTDRVPPENRKKSPYYQKWQKAHQPNQTGTASAYLPPGHVLKGGQREKATGDYEPWTPPA